MPESLKKTTGTMFAFGDVVHLSKERSQDPEEDGFERYIGLEHLESSDLKVRNWGKISDGVTFTSVFRAGQVLFGKRRAYQRKVAIAEFDGVCSGDIYVLEPRGDQLLPELLPFICQSEPFYDYVISMSQGGLSPRVNWKALAKYEFALPPLEQQRRVAQVLRTARDAEERLFDALAAAKTLLTSELNAHFPPEMLRESDSQMMRLGDICERITDGTHAGPEFVSSGVPFLLVGNISSGQVDWNIEKWVTQDTYEELTKSFRPRRGDVLYSVVGVTLGVPILVDWDEPFTFQRHIGVIRTDGKVLDPRYLRFCLLSPFVTIQDRMYEEGNAQKTITLKSLQSYQVPLVELSEQRRIVDRLTMLEAAIVKVEERLTATKEIAKSAANQFFRGPQ